tara:strand:+ start:2891 stop:3424 length:534 start_codon:yes stop_codon:yes gene_type:complete
MPYKLGDRTLALDVPWEHESVLYPANWLRLSTPQDRAELGIVWEEPGESWNEKFYWGYDSDGNLIPKTYTDLKTLWVAKTKETAYTLLQPSDYLWPKFQDENSSFSAAKTAYNDSPWSTWRSTIRTECAAMVTAIEATADVGDTSPHADFGRVQALQEYIEGNSYNVWTPDPDNAET